METIRDRVAGLDVHRDRVAACGRLGDGHRTKRRRGAVATMAGRGGEVAGWVSEDGVSAAGMGATGVDWKPMY